MAPKTQYRIDGAVGMIASGILTLVLGMVALPLALTGEVSEGNSRGWFFALLGVPLGIALLVSGIVQRRRDRRSSRRDGASEPGSERGE